MNSEPDKMYAERSYLCIFMLKVVDPVPVFGVYAYQIELFS